MIFKYEPTRNSIFFLIENKHYFITIWGNLSYFDTTTYILEKL